MRVIKPMALGLLNRPFEFRRKFHLGVSVLAFIPLTEDVALLPETAMWAFAAEAMPPEIPLDVGIPKRGAEFVVIANAYAPGGAAVTQLRAGAMLGERIKTLDVVGDRLWDGRRASVPEPFSVMPLDWRHAYGETSVAENPAGIGGDAASATPEHPARLPNIVAPAGAGTDYRQPVGFAAIDQTWPQRARLCGTHDELWLKQDFPGFARDIDWRFFNAAPADQQFEQPLAGDEAYAFENLHPERPLISGRLPGIAPRLFVTRRDHAGFAEVPLALTTVWFFPDRLRMILVHHGQVEVAEEDAADIEHIVLGADPANALRPAAAYEQVMHLRLDKAKAGGAHALNDALLVPKAWLVPDPAIEAQKQALAGEGLMLKRIRPRMEREHEARRAEIAAKGLDPDVYCPPLPPEEPPSLEDIPAMIETLTARAEAEKQTLDAELRKAEAELAPMLAVHGTSVEEMRAQREAKPKGPPAFSAARLREELTAAAEAFRSFGASAEEIEQRLADPDNAAQWAKAEADLRDAYRQVAHRQDKADAADAALNARYRDLLAQDSAAVRAAYDFHGADLPGLDLSHRDLSGICLDGAQLAGCDFTGSNLGNAVLAHADLRSCRFDGADLEGANLGNSDLGGASFKRAKLKGAVLADAELAGADFEGCDLLQADLTGAKFGDARFDHASAPGLKMLKTTAVEWQAPGMMLDKAVFIETDLAGANFTHASLAGASFIGCRLHGVNFAGANLAKTKFVNGCVLEMVQFSGANLAGANFRGCAMTGSEFTGANLEGADFSEADLTGAQLRRVLAANARLVAAKLMRAQLRQGNFMNADLSRADLGGADLTGASFYEANLARAALDEATRRRRMQTTRMRYLPLRETA